MIWLILGGRAIRFPFQGTRPLTQGRRMGEGAWTYRTDNAGIGLR